MPPKKKTEASSKAAPKKANGADEKARLPLFFNKPVPLNYSDHGTAGIKKQNHFNFAQGTNSIPVNASEFFEAARNYPIVFTKGNIVPVALCGVQEENYFLDENKIWLSRSYVPAYVRKYPFTLLHNTTEDKWVLCVDEESDFYAKDKSDLPFYQADGKPTETTNQVMEMCSNFQRDYMSTVAFCKALEEKNLLTEKTSTMAMPENKKITLGGFLMIDAEAYGNLPDDVFLEWRKKGWTLLIDAVLLSYTNWKYLPQLASEFKKHQKKAA